MKTRRGSGHAPGIGLGAGGLVTLAEDEEVVFDPDSEVDLVSPQGQEGQALNRLSSWKDAGVSSESLPGADGHLHLAHPNPHHGATGDLDKCPFGAMVRAAEAEFADKLAQVPAAPQRQTSMAHNSTAGSSQVSGSIASAFLGQKGGLGLARLDRDEWSEEEQRQRASILPMLNVTTGQIDGTIRPKFSHFSKQNNVQANITNFGGAFYEELFEQAPEIRDELFADKPTELLAVKLGSILHEVVRLLSLETPRELAGVIAEMALKHIDYGLEAKHTAPFKMAMLNTIKLKVTENGHKLQGKTKKAWSWALDEVIGLLLEATEAGRPKVKLLSRSWLFMVERLHEESMEQKGGPGQEKGAKFSMGSDSDSNDSDEDEGGDEDGGGNFFQSVMRSQMKSGFNLAKKAKRKWLPWGKKKERPRKAQATSVKHDPNDLFQTWRRKDALVDGNPDYLNGRLRVGQTFLDVFAARNAWAVRDFNFGKAEGHAEKMGLALELIVNSATKPKVLQHKLRVLALGHNQMGINSGMFPRFGEALFDFLEQVLGAYDAWDDETRSSWEWMWNIVSAAFTRHLDAAGDLATTVCNSWDYIVNNIDIVDISSKVFKALFHRSPDLQKLFVKPTKMQTVMLGKALDLIVRSLTDTHILEVELQGIAMRHIKYDINQGHLNIFGEVLLQSLADLCGPEHWDEDINSAWADVYGHIAEIFGHVIGSGRNLISKALATNDAAELRSALALMTRKKRALAALEIEVDDTVVLPVTWTIEEGQFAMTDVLLRDVLAIRGDRDAYYYGRKVLWQKHPRITYVIIEKAPKLLPTFLDGHMWCSRYLQNGRRRVNFYIKELYGDPDAVENHNAYNTTLGCLVTRLPIGEIAVFSHPVVVFLTDLKWQQFARKDFVRLQLINLCNLICATTYMMIGVDYPYSSFALAILQLGLCFIRAYTYGRSLALQVKHGNGYPVTLPLGGKMVLVPFTFYDIFFWVNMATFAMSLTLFAMSFVSHTFGWKAAFEGHEDHEPYAAEDMLHFAQVAAFTTGLVWIQMAEVFKMTSSLSALLFAMAAVVGDVMRFVTVMALWVVGFSLTIYWLCVSMNLAQGKEIHYAMHIDLDVGGVLDSNAFDLIYYVLMSSIALTGIDFIMNSNSIIQLVYAISAVSTVVVILNLLVSTMVSTYEILQSSFNELAVKSRAQIVLDAEALSSRDRRRDLYDSLYFDDRLDFEEEDDGPSGGVQALLPAETLTHPAFNLLDRVERYVGRSHPDEVWNAGDLFSSGVVANDTAGMNAKNAQCNKMLKTLANDVIAMAGEINNMKRALKIDGFGGATTNGSASQGDGSEAGSDASKAESLPRMSHDDVDNGLVIPKPPNQPKPTSLPAPRKAPAPTKKREAAVETTKQNAEDDLTTELTEADLLKHGSGSSLWLAVDGVVRDCTALLSYHPGGKAVLINSAGQDSTEIFNSAHYGASLAKAQLGMKKLPAVGILNR